MFLFVITDLYDLNNSRVLIEYLASKGHGVTAYFILTPLKAYRQVFLTNRERLIEKVEMSDKVHKHVGHMTDFHEWMKGKQFRFTFICCSFFPQLEQLGFSFSRLSMGKLCMLTWGFDGCKDTNIKAYKSTDYVFAEGPFFYSSSKSKKIRRKASDRIHYSHPYYDIFDQITPEECRRHLGIVTNKRVLLVPETGNVDRVKEMWSPLYTEIINQIPRDLYYIAFKARQKLVTNPCADTIAPHVDLYIEDEWSYPPSSAVAAMASDVCVLPCESRYVLESVMSKKPTTQYTSHTHKSMRRTDVFDAMVDKYRFNSFTSVLRGGESNKKAIKNYQQTLDNGIITKHSNGNCEYIERILLEQ